MLMLGVHEPLELLTMANIVHWYGHILRMALDFGVEGERNKGRLKRHGKCTLPFKMECWHLSHFH